MFNVDSTSSATFGSAVEFNQNYVDSASSGGAFYTNGAVRL